MVSADAAHPRFHDQLTEPRRVVAIDNLKAVLVGMGHRRPRNARLYSDRWVAIARHGPAGFVRQRLLRLGLPWLITGALLRDSSRGNPAKMMSRSWAAGTGMRSHWI
jgi:hypothetical protein